MLEQLNSDASMQRRRLNLERKNYMSLNKTHDQKHRMIQNFPINNTGVFTMALLNLQDWQIKCTVNILFGGLGHYGCYCGKGNSMTGSDAADEIDFVCREHDECYANCDEIKNCKLKSGAAYQWRNIQGEVVNLQYIF